MVQFVSKDLYLDAYMRPLAARGYVVTTAEVDGNQWPPLQRAAWAALCAAIQRFGDAADAAVEAQVLSEHGVDATLAWGRFHAAHDVGRRAAVSAAVAWDAWTASR